MIGFAHRGARAEAPENTIEAFTRAIELGATGLESDVWLTADGIPVLDHDGEVEVGGARAKIAELRRDQLPAWLPTLRELYEACGTGRPLSLDVKDPAAALPTLRVAREVGAEPQLWLCHPSWRVVASWRAASHETVLVESTRVRHMKTPLRERARRMRRLGIDALNLHESDWTAERVEIFRAEGRGLLGWDAQDGMSLRRLVALELNGVFSDQVALMMSVLSNS